MVDIINCNQALFELFGRRQTTDGDSFRISRFSFPIKNDDQIVLVYNTLHNSFAAVDTTTWTCLASGVFAKVKSSDVGLLLDCGILVPVSLDEHKDYIERFAFLQDLSRLHPGIVRYNIYTTTHCNARCPYCFENGIARKHMDAEVADKVVSYIESTYSRTSDEVYFRWFGGEPLVNSRIITYICNRVKAKGIPFYSTTSTNGLLLNPGLIETAKTVWNLRKVRFSFDGLGEVHNKRKNFIGFTGNPFEVTLNNLDYAVRAGLRVVVRLTLDINNATSLFDLAELLISRYGGKNLALYSKCIFSEVSEARYKADPVAVADVLKANAKLTDYILRNGMYDYERLAPSGLRTYFCAANDPHKVVISPDGNLCSCECNCVETEYWGNVFDGITDAECYEKWHRVPPVEQKCLSCPLLPVCTPFIRTCPADYFSCHDRFETTMRLFMLENYRRHRNGLPLLPDSESFVRFSTCQQSACSERKEVKTQ